MTKWEYLVVIIGDADLWQTAACTQGNLNDLGQDGWELVIVLGKGLGQMERVGYFKRPIEE